MSLSRALSPSFSKYSNRQSCQNASYLASVESYETQVYINTTFDLITSPCRMLSRTAQGPPPDFDFFLVFEDSLSAISRQQIDKIAHFTYIQAGLYMPFNSSTNMALFDEAFRVYGCIIAEKECVAVLVFFSDRVKYLENQSRYRKNKNRYGILSFRRLI